MANEGEAIPYLHLPTTGNVQMRQKAYIFRDCRMFGIRHRQQSARPDQAMSIGEYERVIKHARLSPPPFLKKETPEKYGRGYPPS